MMKKLSLFIYVFFLVFLVILPLLIIVTYSFTDNHWNFTLKNYYDAFNNPDYIRIFLRSIKVAILTTFWCLIFSYPVAYFISTLPFHKHNIWIIFLIAPMWTNFVLRTYAWFKILGQNGFVNGFLGLFGDFQIQFLYNETAVVFGMVYNLLPFMIFPIYNTLIKIDHSFIDSARDLGATPSQVFRKIIFPLSMSGVKNGIFLVLIPSITFFAVSDILGGAKNMLIGNLINQSFFYLRNWHLGSALSVILIFIFLLFGFLFNFRSLLSKLKRRIAK